MEYVAKEQLPQMHCSSKSPCLGVMFGYILLVESFLRSSGCSGKQNVFAFVCNLGNKDVVNGFNLIRFVTHIQLSLCPVPLSLVQMSLLVNCYFNSYSQIAMFYVHQYFWCLLVTIILSR